MSELYERDFHAWTEEQAALLRRAARERVNVALDYTNLAEEIETLGRSELRTLHSELELVIEHLLKLRFSSATAPRDGWYDAIDRHRRAFQAVLMTNPGLRQRIDVAAAYRQGRRAAEKSLSRHGDAETTIPDLPPFTFEQMIDEDWYPPKP